VHRYARGRRTHFGMWVMRRGVEPGPAIRPPAGQRLAEPHQRRAHGVLGGKVLQDVRHEHAVE
jgi:hypothetical protein